MFSWKCIFAVGALSMIAACSSSSEGGGTSSDSGNVDTGNVVSDSAPADEGPTDSEAPRDTAVATDTAPADTGPPPTDVADSAECKEFCDALKAACPGATCAPKTDCAIKAGYCAAAEQAYLKCKAETGTFSCGSSGWGVSSSCKRDPSLCSP